MRLHKRKTVQIVAIVSILFTASSLRAQEAQPASKTLSDTTKEFLSDPARTGSLLGTIIAGSAVANPLAPMLGSVAGFLIGKNSAFTVEGENAASQRNHNGRSLFPEAGLSAQAQALDFSDFSDRNSQLANPEVNTGSAGSIAAPGIGRLSEHTDHTVVLGLPRGTVTGNLPEQSGRPVIVGSTGNEITLQRQEQSDQVLIPGLSETTGPSGQAEQQASGFGMTDDVAVEAGSLQKQLADACRNVQLTKPVSLNCYYFSE